MHTLEDDEYQVRNFQGQQAEICVSAAVGCARIGW